MEFRLLSPLSLVDKDLARRTSYVEALGSWPLALPSKPVDVLGNNAHGDVVFLGYALVAGGGRVSRVCAWAVWGSTL